jgi:hypothetical protein
LKESMTWPSNLSKRLREVTCGSHHYGLSEIKFKPSWLHSLCLFLLNNIMTSFLLQRAIYVVLHVPTLNEPIHVHRPLFVYQSIFSCSISTCTAFVLILNIAYSMLSSPDPLTLLPPKSVFKTIILGIKTLNSLKWLLWSSKTWPLHIFLHPSSIEIPSILQQVGTFVLLDPSVCCLSQSTSQLPPTCPPCQSDKFLFFSLSHL